MSLHLVSASPDLAVPTGREVLEALPFAAYTTDAQGGITAFNRAAVEMWGREPRIGEDHWCGSHKLFHSDGSPLPHEDCPMAIALKTGEKVRGVEAVLERPDGRRIHFAPYPAPLFDRAGKLTGGINILVDITARMEADHAKGRLAAIIESSDDAIISKNLDGVIQSWNQGAERIFGYSAEEAIGRHISLLIPPDRRNEEPGIIARIRQGERIDHYETVRQRKDGSRIDISLTVSPVKDAKGQIIGASKIARDITERKRAEEAKDLLLQEIKHRVKNTLGTVQAIAAQTFRNAPREEREAFLGRLRALSIAHDILTHRDWDRVRMHDLVARALLPFQENRAERFRIQGDEAILDSNQALLLSMALHELATNAVKYGALSNPSGIVGLSWWASRQEGVTSLRMVWREEGGPPVVPPSRKGFGSTLFERALQQEQGYSCFQFFPDGVCCTLEMRL